MRCAVRVCARERLCVRVHARVSRTLNRNLSGVVVVVRARTRAYARTRSETRTRRDQLKRLWRLMLYGACRPSHVAQIRMLPALCFFVRCIAV